MKIDKLAMSAKRKPTCRSKKSQNGVLRCFEHVYRRPEAFIIQKTVVLQVQVTTIRGTLVWHEAVRSHMLVEC